MTQALHPLELVAVKGEEDQIDVHGQPLPDLADLVVLEVQVLEVLEDLQVLDVRSYIQEVEADRPQVYHLLCHRRLVLLQLLVNQGIQLVALIGWHGVHLRLGVASIG